MKSFCRYNLFFIPLICATFLAACNKPNEISKNTFCSNREYTCFNKSKRLKIETSKGTFIVKVDGKNAPVTVGHFLDMVSRDVYSKTRFNKVIREPKPYIIQGGDPLKVAGDYQNNNSKNMDIFNFSKLNSRFIPLEISLNNEESPRYNQTLDSVFLNRIKLRHTRGAISMARSQPLDSASSQFYISLRNLPELDGRYAVFGKVIEGFNILDLINEEDYILSIKIIKD